MGIDEFKKMITEADDESNIDELCIIWLKQESKEHGQNGDISKKLLRIICTLMSIDA